MDVWIVKIAFKFYAISFQVFDWDKATGTTADVKK
jgi:hypothetical protein